MKREHYIAVNKFILITYIVLLSSFGYAEGMDKQSANNKHSLVKKDTNLKTTLVGLDSFVKNDGSVELVLTFNGEVKELVAHDIESPPKITIDFFGVKNGIQKFYGFDYELLTNIIFLTAEDRTRMIISQNKSSFFKYNVKGNVVTITLLKRLKEVNKVQSSHITKLISDQKKDLSEKTNQLINVDFTRDEKGNGTIIFKGNQNSFPFDITEKNGHIEISFPKTIIPFKLRNKLDVADFGTNVSLVDVRKKAQDNTVIIMVNGPYEYMAYQTGDQVTLTVKKAADLLQSDNSKTTYKGEKVSFDFQDVNIRTVLQLIADINNLNLVASDSVKGSVTLRLKNVPWDLALNIILNSKGLGKRMEGNVMSVAPAEELAAREKQQLQNEKQIRELAPVKTELITINYANAADLAAVIGNKSGPTDGGLLTAQGSIQVVKRTNSLLIQDTQAKLNDIKKLIAKMDVPVKQVLIEARVVTLSSSYKKELGVKWSGGHINNSTTKPIIVGGKGTGISLPDDGSGAHFNPDKSLSLGNAKVDFDGKQVFTDLSVSGADAVGIGIGFITNGTLLNLELSAILSDGGGEVVSQPKVITADKQMALIKAGKQIPYTESTPEGATTVSFQDAVLSLEVTPQITPDGKVIMDIKVTNDDTTSNAPNGVPIIDKNEVKTQVLVNDGETVVLGGIFKHTKKKSVAKVPFLGDLPILGALFRKTVNEDSKNELMIFITPRIVSEDLTLNN